MVRLTLRSLLAYIDNLLSPSDTAEFEQLLSENETANNLCKRIRSVMTKTELGAPQVLDTSPFADPNMMAEYLDNVLSADNAPDFERTCLTSDRQLAEVAACHQILTVVQVEPANVDLKWRQQVYQLPQFADLVSSGDSFVGKAPVVAPVEESANPLQNLESYAQLLTPEPESVQPEARSGSYRLFWLVAVLVLVAIGGIGVSYMGKSAPQTAQKPANEPAAESTNNQKPADATAEKPIVDSSVTKTTEPVQNEDFEKDSPESATEDTPADLAVETAEETTKATEDSAASDASTPEPAAEPAAKPAVVTISGTDKADNAENPETPDTSEGEDPVLDTAEAEETGLDSENQAKPAEAPAANEEISELPAPKVGYFKGTDQILLQKPERGEDQQWSRMPDGVGVSSNYCYLALPEFRPLILFGQDVSVELIGPARLRVLSRSLDEPLKLQLDFGKIILLTAKKLGRPVILSVKGQNSKLEISAPDTKVALEAVLGTGLTDEPTNPRDGTQFVFYQLRGESRLLESEDNTSVIAARTKVDTTKTNGFSEISVEPSWLSASELSVGAKSLLLRLKQETSSAMVDMRELFNDPKNTPIQTVIDTLAWIGDYKTILDALRSIEKKRIWDFCFDALQRSVLSSDDMAIDLKKQMGELQMTSADLEFYSLLWEYQGILSGTEALYLVDLLESDSMLVRIGAYHLLSERLKTKSGYRAEAKEENARFLPIIRNKVKDGLPDVLAE